MTTGRTRTAPRRASRAVIESTAEGLTRPGPRTPSLTRSSTTPLDNAAEQAIAAEAALLVDEVEQAVDRQQNAHA
jgi:hypothetical protein